MSSVFIQCLLITFVLALTHHIQCISSNIHTSKLSSSGGSNPSGDPRTRSSHVASKRFRRSVSDEVASDLDSEYSLYRYNKRPWSTGKNMAVWGKRNQLDDVIDYVRNDKRKWGGGNMAVWGKRDRFNDEDVQRDEKRKWGGGNMAVWGKRKWSSGNMAVWGKRSEEEEEKEKKRNDDEEESVDEDKRKWNEKNTAVWG